jgi:predicted heme/steroid binding protein
MKHPVGWRVFSADELLRYNGRHGSPAYVACRGIVYDVTDSFLWQGGRHQVLHVAGVDLTASMAQAPHDTTVFDKFPQVGILGEGE